MNITELKKDKKKLLVIAVCVSAIIIGMSSSLFIPSEEIAEIPGMDFSNKSKKPNRVSSKKPSRKRVTIPDPAYKVAPEFEDFQVIAKMYINAMKPFKEETMKWETELLTLRVQREKISLFGDAAVAAESEAKLYRFKNETASLKRNDGGDDYSANIIAANLNDLSLDSEQVSAQGYGLIDIRMSFFAQGNKFAKTAATFKVGNNKYLDIKLGQVFGSQFIVEAYHDEYCATIKDRSTNKSTLICRG